MPSHFKETWRNLWFVLETPANEPSVASSCPLRKKAVSLVREIRHRNGLAKILSSCCHRLYHGIILRYAIFVAFATDYE